LKDNIALLQTDLDELDELVKQPSLNRSFSFEKFGNLNALISKLADSNEINLIILGTKVEFPITVSQRITNVADDAEIIIICSTNNFKSLKGALQISPFLGKEVSCIHADQLRTLTDEIPERVLRSKNRKKHRVWLTVAQKSIGYRSANYLSPSIVLDQIAQLSPIGIIVVKMDGTILAPNKAALEILNSTEVKCIGTKIKEYICPLEKEDFEKHIKNSLHSSIPLGTCIYKTKDKIGKWLQVSGSSIIKTKKQLGEPTGLLIIQDYTKIKKTEKDLQNASKKAEKANNAKSAFLSQTSHEIRTPMHAILGYAQIILREKNLPTKTLKLVEAIESSGDTLLSLINNILDLSKIDAGHMRLNIAKFDLNGLILELRSLFEILCKKKNLVYDFPQVDQSLILEGDSLKIKQVLINLLNNAIKFTEKGSVSLKIVSLENDFFRFDIKDTGIGIPREAHDLIFQPFQQRTENSFVEGTGLGLSISRKLVDLMGGDLTIESDKDKGALFSFTLSLSKVSGNYVQLPSQTKKIEKLNPERSIKALVADDVEDNRYILTRILENLGIEVFEAENGLIAIEKTRTHLPDIIFMDIKMPVLMGDEATKKIIEQFGKDRFKIVAVTANAFDQQKEKYIELGFHEFIPKPFNFDNVHDVLSKFFSDQFIFAEEESTNKICDIDFTKITIPIDLYNRLKESSEIFNITELEKQLDELENLDESNAQLAHYFKRSLERFEIEEITSTLNKIKTS